MTDDINDLAPQGTETCGAEVTCSELLGQAYRLFPLTWVFQELRLVSHRWLWVQDHLVMATNFIEAAQTYIPTVMEPDSTQMQDISPRPAGKGLATSGADVYMLVPVLGVSSMFPHLRFPIPL